MKIAMLMNRHLARAENILDAAEIVLDDERTELATDLLRALGERKIAAVCRVFNAFHAKQPWNDAQQLRCLYLCFCATALTEGLPEMLPA
jgi:hypothetical protein